jgi:hypothetical protein
MRFFKTKFFSIPQKHFSHNGQAISKIWLFKAAKNRYFSCFWVKIKNQLSEHL